MRSHNVGLGRLHREVKGDYLFDLKDYMNLECLIQRHVSRPDDFQALPFGCGPIWLVPIR